MSGDLREALAKIKPGDEVTVAVDYLGHTGTISGKAWSSKQGVLFVAHLVLRYSGGKATHLVTAVLDHKPHVPEVTAEVLDALPVWSVVTDRDGNTWVKHENGLWGGCTPSGNLVKNCAPLTIRHPRDGAA